MSPPPPVAPCHIYSCRARWRRHGRGVIASGHKQAFYSKHKPAADSFTHGPASCVCLPRTGRRRLCLSRAFHGFLACKNAHAVARSLTDQLANRAKLSYRPQPSRREVEDGRKAGAQAQIAGWSGTRRLPVAVTRIRKCYTGEPHRAHVRLSPLVCVFC